jgi:photosystem II stability/assembly factor-like uncharacterized protein
MKQKSILLLLFLLISTLFLGFKGSGFFDRDPNAQKQSGPYMVSGPALDNPLSTLSESFEGVTFPPAGWIKLNPDGGTGWNRQTAGTSPIPGWTGGTITTPPGGGNAVAFCTWTTGGTVANDQWLVTPQLTNIQSGDSLKFWLRYWPSSFRDSIEVRISTTTPTVAAFTTLVFRKNFAVNSPDTNWAQYKFDIGSLVPSGSNIYIGFREVVADNFNDGASFSLDLVEVTSGPPPPPPAALGWMLQNSGQTVGFDGLYVLDANTAWASGDLGRIVKTTDGGDTWVQQVTGTTQYIYSINFVDANTGFAAGGAAAPGVILKSINGGTTWTQVFTAPTLSFLHAIDFVNANTGFIGGNSGIMKTTDAGATWGLTTTAATVYQIDFANENTGWAVGDLGSILKTTDGGTTWVTQVSGAVAPLHDVHALNVNDVWAVGNNGTVRKTTDGGTTWTTVTTPIPASLWAWGVHFANPNTGWISGDNGWMIKTTNGGTSWYRQPVAPIVLTRALYQIKSANPNVVYSVGAVGTILKTVNGGDAPIMNVTATSMNFGNVNVGSDTTVNVRVFNTGTMALTIDSLSINNPVFSVVGITPPVNVPVGDTLTIPVMFTPPDTIQYNGSLRIVGNDPFNPLRTVSLTGVGVGPVGITQYSSEIPTEYELSQNFPNPFNPSTQIKFAIPKNGLVTLKIFDLLGREIATLVNETKEAGYYIVDFDASGFSSGMYFYKIESNGYSNVKKMMMIK